MSDETADQSPKPSAKRGEAGFREAREQVAERNAKARKAGKERRAAYERERAQARREVELREMMAVRSNGAGLAKGTK